MDRAAGRLRNANRVVKQSRPKVARAVGQWASEILEPRTLLSGSTTAALNNSQVVFIKNQGQWSDPSIRYAYQTSGANILMTDQGPIFQVFQPAGNGKTSLNQVLVNFDGSNTVTPIGLDPSTATFNFYGDDRSQDHSGVTGYNEVEYKGLYNGVDLYTYGKKDALKYEFHVAPGADYSQVQVHYSGIIGLSITSSGQLDIKTQTGDIFDDAPDVYQVINGKTVTVKSQFKLIGKDGYTFQLDGSYDHSKELILDPFIGFTTYLGGASTEAGNNVTVDSDNNIYVTGSTDSTDFPTIGPLTLTQGNPSILTGTQTDAFVAKYDASGVLQWGTYLGGSAADVGQDIAVDSSGNVFVVGQTASDDFLFGFPTISDSNPFVFSTYNGNTDGFLADVSTDGQLQYFGFIGGSGNDVANAATIGSDGALYIVGTTSSSDFPTFGAFQGTRNGSSDSFVMKFDPGSRAVDWSSYFGGSGSTDVINDVALDSTGNVYVVGNTNSTDLATLNAFQETKAGGNDAFVAKISQAGGLAISWATYLGGAGNDVGAGIALDSAANVWVTGLTPNNGTDFPLTVFNGDRVGGNDAFVTGFDTNGHLRSSQLIASSGADQGNDIAVDSDNNVIVVGNTAGTVGGAKPVSLPVTNALSPGGFAPGGGQTDGFIARITPSGATTGTFDMLTYFGGTSADVLNAVAVDASGGIIAVGNSGGTDLPLGPTTLGQVTLPAGGTDAIVVRIAPTTASLLPVAPTNVNPVATSMSTVRVTWTDNANNEKSYEVWRGTSTSNIALIATLPSNSTTFNDSGLLPTTTYFYRVFAVNKAGRSGSNPIRSVTTQSAALATPTGLTATAISAKRIDLTWKDNSNNEDGFEIWREDTSLGNFDLLATVGRGVTKYSDQDPNLTPNTQYSYQVRAFNSFDDSDFSDPAVVTTPAADFIIAPTNLTVTPLANPAASLLKWTDNSDNEDHFSIERSPIGSLNFTEIGVTAGPNISTFLDTSVVAGQAYIYRVRAVNGPNVSAYTNLATTDPAHALAAPTRLQAVAVSTTSIQIMWVNNASIQTGFVVERAINSPSGWVAVATVGPKVTSFTNKKLISNRRYYFRVRAFAGNSFTAYSNTDNATTFPVSSLQAPAAPTNLKASNITSSSVQLNWTDNAINETAYVIERSTSLDGTYTNIGRVGVNVRKFIDKSVKPGQTYFYRVRAFNGSYKSFSTNVVKVSIAAAAKAKKALVKAAVLAAPAAKSTFSTTQIQDIYKEFGLLY